MTAAMEAAYFSDKRNMESRFVVHDGEVWMVRGVFIGSTGLAYTLSNDSGRFVKAFPEECASCVF